jgi:hypothetical protein
MFYTCYFLSNSCSIKYQRHGDHPICYPSFVLRVSTCDSSNPPNLTSLSSIMHGTHVHAGLINYYTQYL